MSWIAPSGRSPTLLSACARSSDITYQSTLWRASQARDHRGAAGSAPRSIGSLILPSNCRLPSGAIARVAAEVVVVEREGLGIARLVRSPWRDRHDRGAVVVHVVTPDRAGGVGDPVRILRVGGAQQDRGAVDRAGREHEQPGPDCQLLAAALDLCGDDALAPFVGKQTRDQASGLQSHVGVRKRRVDQPGLGVALRADLARKGVAGAAANAGAAGMKVDGRRHVRRMQTARLHALEDLADDRFVRDRWMREWARAWRLGRVVAGLAMHAEHALGLPVPGFQLGIANRPRHGRYALGVLDAVEVPLAEAEHRRAIDLGVTADVVELARAETPCPRRRTRCPWCGSGSRRIPLRGPSSAPRAAAALRAPG